MLFEFYVIVLLLQDLQRNFLLSLLFSIPIISQIC
ncbi:hypothetical protein BDE02_06G150800 [Populus trichocarpa]|nr:hypothetical protein BDE02_06G150800 [Populus trichocarpa]